MRAWSQDDIMSVLFPHLEDIEQSIRIGHAAYRAYDPKHLVEHSARMATNCTYGHTISEARRRFSGKPGIKELDVNGLIVFNADDKALFRFKKMNKEGQSRNYPTQQAKDYDAQKPLPGLPPEAARLRTGYQLDPSGTKIEQILVVRPRGKHIEWASAIVLTEEPRWVDITPQRTFGFPHEHRRDKRNT